MVTDFVKLCLVAVRSSLLSHAIKLSLPCSAFESVSLIVTTQRILGFGQTYLGITHNQYITHGGEYGYYNYVGCMGTTNCLVCVVLVALLI